MSYIEWPLYKQILEVIPIVCVDVAVVENGRVLLLRRRDAPARGQLWLPGGRVLKGETLRQSAARKAQDEAGITCQVGPLIHTEETIFDDGPDGIAVHSVNVCFFLFPEQGSFKISLDNHHEEWIWVDSIKGDLHPYIKRCLSIIGLS